MKILILFDLILIIFQWNFWTKNILKFHRVQIFDKNNLKSRFLIRATASGRSVFVRFLKSPVEFLLRKNGSVEQVKCEETKLEGETGKQKAVNTGKNVQIPADIVFRSIGYKSISMEGVPFDAQAGIIPNQVF